MPNMSENKVEMALLDPIERRSNFEEVALGYTLEQAMEEADRCLQCKHQPCVALCPVNVKIPQFLKEVKEGNILKAYDIISETNALPAVCGRVCPQEEQCESACVRAIKHESVGIGRIERFVADYYLNHMDEVSIEKTLSNGIKAAVIGAGPAGLTCAKELALKGYDVHIFEALHKPGGVLVYGIPEFRLPNDIVEKEIEQLKRLGVTIECDVVVGKTIDIEELFNEENFKSIFIGSGAGLPRFMNIPGENLNGVFSANEFLTRFNLMKAYDSNSDTPIALPKKLAVVGGGNVAMDAARCAKRLGIEEVYIVYRRDIEQLPARHEEIEHAMEEGIIFKTLTNPVAVIGDDNYHIKALECIKMGLSEPDASGRARPIELEGSNFELDVDCMVMAIGTSPNPLLVQTTKELQVNKWGCLEVDETLQTTYPGVFAGGDAVSGAATVILAMGAGKDAADSMDLYMKNK